LVCEEVFHLQRGDAEPADGEHGAVERERGNDHVDAGPVRKAGIHQRGGFIDPPADLRDDPLDDGHQMVVILEGHLGSHELSLLFDVYLGWPVDQDVGNFGVLEQRLQRTKTKRLMLDLEDQTLTLDPGEGDSLACDEAFDDRLDDSG
jgi:hypothetical protein